MILRNAKIVNLTAAEAFQAMDRTRLDHLVVKLPLFDPVEALREHMYRWCIELASAGASPPSSFALPNSLKSYLMSFCHHGYPELAPRFQSRKAEAEVRMAVHNLVDKCLDT
jgi:hypothetical protein